MTKNSNENWKVWRKRLDLDLIESDRNKNFLSQNDENYFWFLTFKAVLNKGFTSPKPQKCLSFSLSFFTSLPLPLPLSLSLSRSLFLFLSVSLTAFWIFWERERYFFVSRAPPAEFGVITIGHSQVGFAIGNDKSTRIHSFCVCVCVCVCVCSCERERERGVESVRQIVCVCLCVNMCVCVCARERE